MSDPKTAERWQLRLVFTAFPAASVPAALLFGILLSGPTTVIWLLGTGLMLALIWTAAVWWPVWRWFHRNGFPALVRIPFMVAAGALLCLPFIVLSPVTGGLVIALFAGLLGTAVGAAGGLAAAAVEGARRLREAEQA